MAAMALRQSHLRWASVLRLVRNVRCHSDGSCSTSHTTSPGEENLKKKLKLKFPKATLIEVNDISGGCGSMYQVQVIAEEFRGFRTVLQHRMINEALKEEIKGMHGLRISTMIPDSS